MGPFEPIKHAINEFIERTGARESQMLIVMGESLMEVLKQHNRGVMATCKKAKGQLDKIFGVEIMVHERIKDEFFGIMWQSCRDHIDEHLDEVLGEEDPDQPEWIQCDLCGHPLSTALAQGCDIKCLWCGDVNDLDDLLGDEE